MRIRLLSVFMLASILSACSQPAQNPDNPSSSTTLVVPPVSSPVSATILPANAVTKSIGTPVPGWENIPIVPGAHDPELEDMVYLYTVDAPVDQVEEYYQTKMTVNGWSLTNRQVVEATESAGPSTVLDFQKKDQFLNVMLVNLADQNATTVILTQLGP
jgi:hypothetical protein